jgi:hypothetical protein
MTQAIRSWFVLTAAVVGLLFVFGASGYALDGVGRAVSEASRLDPLTAVGGDSVILGHRHLGQQTCDALAAQLRMCPHKG